MREEFADRGPSLEERGRDGFTEAVISENFRRRQSERDRELDAMIAMGWGGSSPFMIPADWRTRRGPEKGGLTLQHRAKISAGRRAQTSSGKPTKVLLI